MPITTSAKKALRRDRRKTVVNLVVRKQMKQALKEVREKKSKKALSVTYSALDRAAKKGVIKKTKASRLKSRLANFLQKTPKEKEAKPKAKKQSKISKKRGQEKASGKDQK